MQDNFQGDGLWKVISKSPRPQTLIDYPRKDPGADTNQPMGKILLRLLSQQEQVIAAGYAHRFAEEALLTDIGAAYEDVYRIAVSLEILQRACMSAERFKKDGEFRPFFPPVKILRTTVTKDETDYLVGAYLALSATKGAVVCTIDPEDVDYWAMRLSLDAVGTLASLSQEAMTALLIAMATKLTAPPAPLTEDE